MKRYLRYLLTAITVLCLTCVMALAASAISFSLQHADRFYLQIPGPVADTVPDTDVSHASAVLEYGSVIPSDQYKIKRIQWKETYNTNTTVSRFSDSAARYLVIVTLETTDGDFWNIPSNYIAEINGFAATVENQGDGTLEISAYVHTLPAVELNQYWLDGEDLSLDRIWWEYGYKASISFWILIFRSHWSLTDTHSASTTARNISWRARTSLTPPCTESTIFTMSRRLQTAHTG